MVLRRPLDFETFNFKRKSLIETDENTDLKNYFLEAPKSFIDDVSLNFIDNRENEQSTRILLDKMLKCPGRLVCHSIIKLDYSYGNELREAYFSIIESFNDFDSATATPK